MHPWPTLVVCLAIRRPFFNDFVRVLPMPRNLEGCQTKLQSFRLIFLFGFFLLIAVFAVYRIAAYTPNAVIAPNVSSVR